MQNLHRAIDCTGSIGFWVSVNKPCLWGFHLGDASKSSSAVLMYIRPFVPPLLVRNISQAYCHGFPHHCYHWRLIAQQNFQSFTIYENNGVPVLS